MPDPVVRNFAQLAELAGVSKATVSLALRNHPRISEKTRKRVQELARKHNYRMNPLVTAQMVSVQKGGQASGKSSTTVALVGPKALKEAHDDMNTPLQYYYKGIHDRADELGFSIDYIPLLPGDSKNRRLGGILSARGIRGVIFCPLTEDYPLGDFDFAWDDYTTVAIEHTFATPRLHSICNDEFDSIGRMLDRLSRSGFKRIGIAMMKRDDLHVKHHWLAGYLAYCQRIPVEDRIPTFITSDWSKDSFLQWYRNEKPEVIVCIDDTVSKWLSHAGIEVPEEVSLASLYWLPSRSWLSGYYQNHEAMGAAAMDLMSANLYRNDYGLPKEPKKVLIQSVWKPGRTMRARSENSE